LRADATIYWCGQSLFKYLPQYDPVLPRIAREAGPCQFAFIEYQSGAEVTSLFKRRLDKAFADAGLSAADYCRFLPRLDQAGFLSAMGLADVVLDSIGWSGCNSTLEALAFDLPIVSLPGALMRGRHTAAILRMIGVTDTIADSIDGYVATAVRLGRDASWRAHLRAQIAAQKHRVYRDRSCIAALETFLQRVARGEKT
jgi:predicted O-linked N-acetylglucosamine transferase (SPINDLY family)